MALTLNSFFFFLMLRVWWFHFFFFFTFSIVFPITGLIINLKNLFLKSFCVFFLSSVMTLMYGFSHGFWLNLMTLCTFFKTNPWFNDFFKFIMWIPYLIISCKLATSFSDFSIFILSGKRGKWFWTWYKYFGYWISTSRKYPLCFFHCSFLKNLHRI